MATRIKVRALQAARPRATDYCVDLDGDALADVRVSRTLEGTFYLEAHASQAVDVLLSYEPREYDGTIAAIEIRSLIDRSLGVVAASFDMKRRMLEFRLRFDSERWVGLWPLIDYVAEMQRLSRNANLWWRASADGIPHVYQLRFSDVDVTRPLRDTLERSLTLVRTLNDQARRDLFAVARPGSLLLEFEFADEIRASCEQYLVFFGEFMRDLGVAVRTELIDETERILFAVTPHDRQQSLQNIRDALDLYLELPNGKLASTDEQFDVVVAKLNANIHHLQGQLELARAVAITQRSAIIAQDAAIEALSRRLTDGVTYASIPSSNDRESVIDNVVAVRPVEAYGIEIDLPNIVRRLRQFFAKKRPPNSA